MDLYAALGGHFPEARFTQFNRLRDESQLRYFVSMHGSGRPAWSHEMLRSLDEIGRKTPNFAPFVAGGTGHCVTPTDEFYDLEVEKVRVVDWVRQRLQGRIENVRCDDPECDATALRRVRFVAGAP